MDFTHPEFSFVFESFSDNFVKYVKKEINKHGIETAARLLGRKSNSDKNLTVAGRLLIFDLRRKVAPTLLEYLEDMERKLQPKYYEYMKLYASELQEVINASTEKVYANNDYFSFSCYKEMYLAKMPYADIPAEIPEYLFIRVAVQLHFEHGIDRVIQCYNEQLEGYYTLASPTLFNSCFHKNSLSSCYIGRMEDDLNSILTTCADFGMISKGCGAFGFDISTTRESEIAGTAGTSDINRWLMIMDAICVAVDQEKKRPGSAVASNRIHHLGIKKFVNIVSKVGDRYETAHHINISLFTCRLFWERVRSRSKWTLFCPAKTQHLNDIDGAEFTLAYEATEILAAQREQEYRKWADIYSKIDKSNYKDYREVHKKYLAAKEARITHEVVDAYELLLYICRIQRGAGQPFVNNGDAINYKYNLRKIGRCCSCNLCQEVTLPASFNSISSCNLGSICLYHFVFSVLDRNIDISLALKKSYDFNKLGFIVRSMVDNLNSVIDYNKYPLDQYLPDGTVIPGKIHKPNKKLRPIGLGVQGFAECNYTLDLRIEDDKPYVDKLNLFIFACIYFNALVRSVQLAIQDGAHEDFDKTMLAEGKFQFDLWADELAEFGPSPNPIRQNEPEVISPNLWGQGRIELGNGDYIDPTWDDLRRAIMKYGTRNSMLICIMPTASSSQILRSTESVEIPNSNLYSRVLVSGNYVVLNRFMVADMDAIGLWNDNTHDYLQFNSGSLKNFDKVVFNNPDLFPDFNNTKDNWDRLTFLIQKYKTMWEISQKWMIDLMARRSRYICHSASLNIYLADPTDEQLMAALMYTFDSGLKTMMYYLRQKTSSEGQKINIKPEIQKLFRESIGNDVFIRKNNAHEVVMKDACTNHSCTA